MAPESPRLFPVRCASKGTHRSWSGRLRGFFAVYFFFFFIFCVFFFFFVFSFFFFFFVFSIGRLSQWRVQRRCAMRSIARGVAAEAAGEGRGDLRRERTDAETPPRASGARKPAALKCTVVTAE